MSTDTPEAKTSTPMVTVDNLEQLAERVDKAIAEVQALDPDVRVKAMTLKSTIEEFHKVGLTHIVKKLKDDPEGKKLLFELVDEPTVYALFAMHGLVRADLKTQVERVIEMVRPYMQSHGGDVSLVDVKGKTVYVRLSGNCNGCSMSAVTLRNTVEESLAEHVPEIEKVEVVPTDPEPDPAPCWSRPIERWKRAERRPWMGGRPTCRRCWDRKTVRVSKRRRTDPVN